MRKLTKVLALTLASSMALSLAACGGSSSSSAGTAASGSTAASSATSSAGTQDGVVAEAFVDEADRRIQILEKRGYTKDQAIRVLMLYAMQPKEA